MDILLEGLKVSAIGIGVTFAMLFLIVLFVKILPYIIKYATKFGSWVAGLFRRKKKAVKPQEATVVELKPAQPAAKVQSGISAEEIAAIMAAISCLSVEEGKQFVLRSVKRTKAASAWRSTNF